MDFIGRTSELATLNAELERGRGQPFCVRQSIAGGNPQESGEGRADHALFEPQRVCNLCFLPQLWACDEMPGM